MYSAGLWITDLFHSGQLDLSNTGATNNTNGGYNSCMHTSARALVLYTLAHLTEPSLMLLATPVLDKSKGLPLERSIEDSVNSC